MMNSYFKGSVKMTDILFKGWETTNVKDAVIASLIVLVMTMFYEWTKVTKAYIIIRRRQSPLTYGKHDKTEQPGTPQQLRQHGTGGADAGDVHGSFSSTIELLSSLKIPASIEQIRKWRITLFILESIIQTFNFVWGYILMLLVMTYSLWFLGAILVGSGLGYFLFNPIQQMYAEKYLNTQPNDVSSEAQRTSGQTINRDGAINQDWVMSPNIRLLEET